LSPRAVQFIEIPTVPYPGDPLAWVRWAQPQAGSLFAAIAHDTRLPSARRRARNPVATVEAVAARSPGTADLARRYGGITGSISICGDGGAFSGPDGHS